MFRTCIINNTYHIFSKDKLSLDALTYKYLKCDSLTCYNPLTQEYYIKLNEMIPLKLTQEDILKYKNDKIYIFKEKEDVRDEFQEDRAC